MFSRWMELNGASRTTSTSLRRSFRMTSAARWIRFSPEPEAIAPRVRALHGHTTMPRVRKEPLEIFAPWSCAE